jgi:hypothetical protein
LLQKTTWGPVTQPFHLPPLLSRIDRTAMWLRAAARVGLAAFRPLEQGLPVLNGLTPIRQALVN